ITLESDKASMEVPSSHAGGVKKLRLKVGEKASEGTVILELEAADAAAATDKDEAADSAPAQPAATSESAAAAATASTPGEPVTVVVPEIGDDGEVDVIEVSVRPGDTVELEQTLS